VFSAPLREVVASHRFPVQVTTAPPPHFRCFLAQIPLLGDDGEEQVDALDDVLGAVLFFHFEITDLIAVEYRFRLNGFCSDSIYTIIRRICG
jgi:hypothetical protein